MRRYSFALMLVLLPACLVDLKLKGAPLVQCSNAHECPVGFTCRLTINRCVATDAPQAAPPTVSNAVLSPALAKRGDLVTASFDVSEPLGADPQVAISGSAPWSLDETQTRRSALHYVYLYKPAGTEAESTPLAVLAAVANAEGNQTSTSLATVLFDFTPPKIAALGWTLPAQKTAAKTNDALVVSGVAESGALPVSATLIDDRGVVLSDLTQSLAVSDSGAGTTTIDLAVDLLNLDLSGSHTLFAQIVLSDAVGNTSLPATGTTPPLPIDLAPPGAPSVTIAGKPTTQTTALSLTLTAEGATGVYIEGADVLPGLNANTWLFGTFPLTATITVANGSGPRTVKAIFRDGADNRSAEVSDSIDLAVDTQPPQVTSFAVTPAFTAARLVTLSLIAQDNQSVAKYLVTLNNTPPTTSAFIDAAPETSFLLPDADGGYTLYPWALDTASIVSSPKSGTPTFLDRQAPHVTGFNVSTASPSNAANVAMSMSDSDPAPASGVANWLINESAAPPQIGDFTLTARPTSYAPSSGDGIKTMYAWVADKAGNISAAFTPQTITLDRTPPVVTFVAPTSVPTRSVTFTTLSATDSGSGVVKYLVVEGAGAVTAAAFPSVKPTSITLSNKEGVHTLYAYALDAAGNISAPVTQQVVFGEFSVACDQLARVAVNASGVFAVAGLQSVYVPVSQASYDHTKVSAYTAAGAPLWVVDEAPPDPFSFTAPSVGIDGSGNVAAAWLAPSATVGEIDARRYSSAGVAGSLFKVNTTALAGGGSGPNTTALAMNDGGQFVVVWDSYGADGDGWGVYAQRYAVSGVVGSEFRVNSVTIGDQHFPEVGMRSDGSFVICFQNGPDGNPKVDCVAYGSDGAVTKAELTVVSNSNGNLAVSTSGFVVAWTDVIGQGIQMQRFHTDGTIDGAVMFGSGGDVSGTGHGSQTWPSVGMAPSGAFRVAWDDDGINVSQQPFAANNSSAGSIAPLSDLAAATRTFPRLSANASQTVAVWISDDGAGTVTCKGKVLTP